ncbi:MAG: PCYCGC domain-containing protein [Deltaproteobacteria bacterium]|nr:PCYCGC domain-containing protein [Deltaproteobacteria bacterium]
MAKKKKKHKRKKRTTKAKQSALQSNKRSKFPLIASIAGGVLVLIGIYFLYPEEKLTQQLPDLSEMKKEKFNLQENRPTLSPQRFSGTVRLAYEVARAIPEVLDRLYCYCRCQENFGHKNLLSCYVDTHASL